MATAGNDNKKTISHFLFLLSDGKQMREQNKKNVKLIEFQAMV